MGNSPLEALPPAFYNSAFGIYSLLSVTDGKFCTGVGGATLLANTADENTAVGAGALLSSTTGTGNTANGAFGLFSSCGGRRHGCCHHWAGRGSRLLANRGPFGYPR